MRTYSTLFLLTSFVVSSLGAAVMENHLSSASSRMSSIKSKRLDFRPIPLTRVDSQNKKPDRIESPANSTRTASSESQTHEEATITAVLRGRRSIKKKFESASSGISWIGWTCIIVLALIILACTCQMVRCCCCVCCLDCCREIAVKSKGYSLIKSNKDRSGPNFYFYGAPR